jgi:hypothetical protein
MVNSVSSAAPSPAIAVRTLPAQAAAPVAEPQAVATRDSLQLSRPNLAVKPPVKPAHSNGWNDLGEVVSTMIYSPIASVLGGLGGFLIGGPVGAAIGASLGGSAPGLAFATKNLVHHLGHVARKEDTDNNSNLKLAGKLMIIPGSTLAGAGIGFALGGPIGAAIGGAVGSAAIPLGGLISAGLNKLFNRTPVPQNPVQPE